MPDTLKSISAELAEKIAAHFESEEVKALIATTKAASDEDTGTFEVVATTENLDRYQEVIKLDGWELEHFRRNPVILWGHDHSKPIGMATSVEIADGKMVVKGKFAPTEKAQEIRQLYDFGVIRATSVGFIEKDREGNIITKAELIELSFVSVPANPWALRLSMEKGLSIDDLVTKGVLFVEKEQEPKKDAEVGPKTITLKIGADVTELKQVLNEAIAALEAVGSKAEEPEGGEHGEQQTEEEKAFAEFTAKRELLQKAATILGDVLADARQAIKARTK